MKLLEVDWNAKGGAADVPVEYPDEVIAEFMNWLRRTSAWHEDVELVHRRVRRLNSQLADHRNAAVTIAPIPTVAERRTAGLAKAREVKRQRRVAAAGADRGA